jgi:3-oxoadipate enol-lactonase
MTMLSDTTSSLHVVLEGEAGTPVVLSHALGLDLTMWDDLAALLAARHRVLRYDHRGHGASATPPGPYTMDDLVDDAARVVRDWEVGPVVWIGLSMGGMVGQGLAIRYPALVRALVLANTTAQYPDAARAAWTQRIAAVEQGGMAAVADMVVERYLHSDFRASQPRIVQALRQQILGTDPAGYVASCQAVRAVDWLAELERIRVLTLVLAGARDAGATPAMADAIASRISGAERVVLDDASHLSVAEVPQQFTAVVEAFLRRV